MAVHSEMLEKNLHHLEYADVFLEWNLEVVFRGKADPL